MCFNTIREIRIFAKISEPTVPVRNFLNGSTVLTYLTFPLVCTIVSLLEPYLCTYVEILICAKCILVLVMYLKTDRKT